MMLGSIERNARVLVTGGTGTLGEALIPALLQSGAQVRVISRDEAKQGVAKRRWPEVDFMLGDVRDADACADAVRNMEVVIHAASLKYVDVSEQQPSEYTLTNVLGTMNLLTAILAERTVKQVVGISTDKACAPFNTYGLTKALVEKLFIEAHEYRRGPLIRTVFTICRYGNVIGSRGSVVLKWKDLREQNKPIQVTDPTMTRFFFTIEDALTLIDVTLGLHQGGVVVSQAMPACTVGDLAEVMAGGSEVQVVGRRPGEKPHEDLLSAHEIGKTRYLDGGRFFLYEPLWRGERHTDLFEPYTSYVAPRLSLDRLREMTAQWR